MERGLNLEHEDLPRPESYAGEEMDLDHGTAVMGEIFGEHNGIGISGIAPETEMHLAIFDTHPPFPVIADALNAETRSILHRLGVQEILRHPVDPTSLIDAARRCLANASPSANSVT